MLKGASTVGEMRHASLPAWVEAVATSMIENLEDQGPVEPDTTWPASDAAESVSDVVPVPWDARSVAAWFGAERFATYGEVGGASPGGHGDTYTVRDRDELFAALQAEGYTSKHCPGLANESWPVFSTTLAVSMFVDVAASHPCWHARTREQRGSALIR